MLQQREDDREEDRLLDANEDHRRRRDQRDPEFGAPLRQDGAHARDVDEFHADVEHHRGQHRVGHIRQRFGQEEQHDEDDHACGELRNLAAPPCAIDHLGLGGTAIHDKGARQASPDAGEGETDKIAVLAKALVVLGGICSGRGGALGEDDEETGEGDGDEGRDVAPGHALWQAECGQTAWHRAQR